MKGYPSMTTSPLFVPRRLIKSKLCAVSLNILKAIATEAYKCKANENPDYINVMLNPLIKPYNLRGGPRAEQPKVNTTSCGLHSFKCQIAKLWNEMPSHIKEATSLYKCKSLLSKWAGPECTCGSCVLCKVYDVQVFFLIYHFFYWLVGLYTILYYFHIITDLCFSQTDELYQSPHRRCHVSYCPNVCL